MRFLTEHQVPGSALELTIQVLDEPGSGGACHTYMVDSDNASAYHLIHFQEGPIAEHGVNGITHEALLAIVADRLQSFQAGPYACDANHQALFHIIAARNHLQARTRERLARGVEGTHKL